MSVPALAIGNWFAPVKLTELVLATDRPPLARGWLHGGPLHRLDMQAAAPFAANFVERLADAVVDEAQVRIGLVRQHHGDRARIVDRGLNLLANLNAALA